MPKLTDGKTVFEVPQQYAESILKAVPELQHSTHTEHTGPGLDPVEVESVGGISHGHISNFPLPSVVQRPKGQK